MGRVKGRQVGGQTEVGADRNQGGQSKGKAGRWADRGGCRQETGWADSKEGRKVRSKAIENHLPHLTVFSAKVNGHSLAR